MYAIEGGTTIADDDVARNKSQETETERNKWLVQRSAGKTFVVVAEVADEPKLLLLADAEHVSGRTFAIRPGRLRPPTVFDIVVDETVDFDAVGR